MNYLKRFYPVDKTVYKKPYEPLILTKSKYYIPTYGTKQFRDENNGNGIVGEVINCLLNLKVNLAFYLYLS